VTAATAVVAAVDAGGRWLIDVAMSSVTAHVAHGAGDETWRAGEHDEAALPAAPPAAVSAPALGEHTASILREFRCL
ncbi:MAG: hypothetical protein ACRD0U_09810, partial [Acidimicrobiales bacterium]